MAERHRRKQRERNASALEIDVRIRNVADYIGALIAHENIAHKAATCGDAETELDALRRFERDLQAFLAAARTARNYLLQTAEEYGWRVWLEARLAPDLFAFHGALSNQDTHDHAIALGKTWDLAWTGTADIVRLVDGGELYAIPSPTGPARLGALRYTYRDADLEPAVRVLYDNIKTGPKGRLGVIALAGDYLDGLRAILRDAEREGRFRHSAATAT